MPILQIVWETLRDLADGKGANTTSAYKIPAWTMSVFDRNDGLAVTPDGLRCQSRDQNAWNGCRGTTGVRGDLGFLNLLTIVLLTPLSYLRIGRFLLRGDGNRRRTVSHWLVDATS